MATSARSAREPTSSRFVPHRMELMRVSAGRRRREIYSYCFQILRGRRVNATEKLGLPNLGGLGPPPPFIAGSEP